MFKYYPDEIPDGKSLDEILEAQIDEIIVKSSYAASKGMIKVMKIYNELAKRDDKDSKKNDKDNKDDKDDKDKLTMSADKLIELMEEFVGDFEHWKKLFDDEDFVKGLGYR